jgi:hypothetical protein
MTGKPVQKTGLTVIEWISAIQALKGPCLIDKKASVKGWPDTIVVRQREQIPGVWDRHNASGEKTVVVDCRNATAEIKELFQQFSHSSHGPGSQLPGYPTKQVTPTTCSHVSFCSSCFSSA